MPVKAMSRRGLLACGAAAAMAHRTAFVAGRERLSMASNIAAQRLEGADTVFELRQYTLYGGHRDTLIELFENEFVEPQEALGAHVLGTFRDADDPDRFVWIRGFADMVARKTALENFYGGRVWKAHRTAANATMVDSDNVLLMRALPHAVAAQPWPVSYLEPGADTHALYGAWIFDLGTVDAAAFAAWFLVHIEQAMTKLGAAPVARFATVAGANNFPALPVRNDRAFVWLGRWPSAERERAFHADWTELSGWRDALPTALLPALFRKPERLRLLPTARSLLR